MACAPGVVLGEGRAGAAAPRGKRACDLVLGSLLALGALPIVLALAVATAVALRAWPIFVHRRIGHHGRPFGLPKLRTLPPSTDPYLLKADLASVPTHALCRFLRRHHLDELPQLFLVPAGRLSLVGPRPKMPEEVEPTDADYAELRVGVPQGCSGLWQISRDSGGMPHEAPHYDLFYLRHRSLRLDLWVIGRTPLVMLGLAPPVTLGDVPGWARRRRAAGTSPR